MKCNEPSTTSCVSEPRAERGAEVADTAAREFEAVLLQSVLKPMGSALGSMAGGMAVDACALAVARADRSGLAAMIEGALERSRDA